MSAEVREETGLVVSLRDHGKEGLTLKKITIKK